MKRKILLILAAVMLLWAFAGCESAEPVDEDSVNYEKAEEAYDAGDYEEAADLFDELGSYEDSEERAIESKYMYAETLFEAGDYAKAAEIYGEISSYEDSSQKLLAAQTQLMYVTYADVFTALSQGVWFYEATSVNAVNVIAFTQESANIKQIYYDGNGPHTTAVNACQYVVDDQNVTVTLADQSELQLAYTIDGGVVSFGDGYFTPEQVAEGLNGYWGLRDSSYNAYTGLSISEYIYHFDNGKVKYESATTAYGYDDGSYYYYGPYEGTYAVNENGLVVDARNEWQFGFVISAGKVVMCRCGDILTVYDGFKGEDGFSF